MEVVADGTPHPRCANEDGAALARRRKELRYPELAGQHGRAKLVVLASEVGGRWSEECRQFLCQLASRLGLSRTSQNPSGLCPGEVALFFVLGGKYPSSSHITSSY